MITQSYTLSLQPGGIPVRIPCVQGDAGSRTISLSLISGGTSFTPPTGAVATFDGAKPDGKSFSVSGTISDSTVSVTLTAQMTAVAGEIPCRLTLVNGTEVLGTAEALLVVAPSAIPADPDLSDSDMSAFETLKNAAAQSAITATEQASSAAASASAAAASAAQAAESASRQVGTADLANSAVTNAKISDSAVTSAKISNSAVSTAKIATYAVTADKLGASAVTTNKIANNAVTPEKISDDFAVAWTPTVSGAASYSTQIGRYVKIGDVAIVSFAVYGTFAGSTTERIKISGCPLTPVGNHFGGGGDLSGYTAASNIIFTGWKANANGNIYAVGQETGITGTNKWGSEYIYQKASGGFSASGSIIFQTSD